VSQKPSDTGPMQHPAETLLRTTRDDHSPTAADRERVRRALIQRLAQNADTAAPEVTALHGAARISPWLKLGFGLVVATGAALAIVRSSDSREPAASGGTAQPAAASTVTRAPVPSSAGGMVAPTPTTATLPSSVSAPSSSALPTRERVPLTITSGSARPARQPATREASSRRLSKVQSADAALAHNPDASPASEAGDHTTGGGDTQIALDDGQHVARTTNPAATPARSEHDEPARAQAGNTQNTSQPLRDQATPAARPRSPLSAAATSASATETKPPTSTPANAELAFVKRIQAALQAGEPQRVLELSQEHERRWPQGTFVQEREGLRTIAACRAHIPSAVSGANKFSAAYPRSPMLSKVHSACTPPSAAKPAR
jgi:hypothetical protein